MRESDKIYWVDFIRVFSTFSVVLLHASAPLLYRYNSAGPYNWWIANVYDASVRMCVPLFFMLSGFLLLGKTEPLPLFFKKRIRKVLIPLIVWTLFYLFWQIYYEKTLCFSFRLLTMLLIHPVYYHLWFLYALLGLYLVMPFLRIIVRESGIPYLYVFLFLWMVAASLIPLLEREAKIESKIDLAMVSGYAGYLVLGYLLGKLRLKWKCFMISSLLVIVSAGITAAGAFCLTVVENGGKFVPYFYKYLSPNVIALSVFSFISLRYIAENMMPMRSSRMKRVIKTVNPATLGIYLIHPVFLFILEKGAIAFRLSNVALDIPVKAVIAFSLSFIFVSGLRKIPVVRRAVP